MNVFLWILLSATSVHGTSMEFYTGREALHHLIETQFGTCGAGQEIRIMGYLIDFETNLGHDTLRQNVIRSMRQGCQVSIVIDGTTLNRFQVARMNLECIGVTGQRCVVVAKSFQNGGFVVHTKLVSSPEGCVLSSGDINQKPWYDTALQVRNHPVCKRLNLMFDDLWNVYKPGSVRPKEAAPVDPPSAGLVSLLVSVPYFERNRFQHQADDYIRTALEVVGNATSSVFVSDQFMNAETLCALMLEKANQGLNVTVVTNSGPLVDARTEHHVSLLRLRDHENVTFLQSTCAYIHLKTLIVDDDVLILGSTVNNPSSLFFQHEASFVIKGEEVKGIAKRTRDYVKDSNKCSPFYKGEFHFNGLLGSLVQRAYDALGAKVVSAADTLALGLRQGTVGEGDTALLRLGASVH